MKIQTLFLVSIIGFFCNSAIAKDVTGLCKDGTETSGTNKRSACRGHDGIKEWYGDSKSAKSDSDDDSKGTSKSKKSKAKEEAASEEASGPATGVCKDGYVTTGTNKRSACRGHDGIKEWYADKEKDEPAAKSKSKSKAKADEADAEAATGPATGVCKDGYVTSGTNKRSACRGHDGIKEWYADKEKAAPAEKEPAAEKSTKGKSDEAKDTATGPATGMCKDGTETSGTNKRSACRGHKGIKEWYADSEEKDDELVTPAAKSEPADKKSTAAAEPPARKVQKAPAAGSGQVWVNTKSKIYHCEGSRFYGATKQGEYMGEGEAAKQGFRANRNKACN